MSGHFDSDEDLGINRSIFENSLDAILLTKLDGSILAANPAAEKMFDMTKEEIKAAGRDGLVVQDDNLKSAVEARALRGMIKAELTFKRKNGTTFPGEVTSTIFKDGNGNDRTNITIKDLSELKHAEKLLLDSIKQNRLLSDLLESSMQPFAVGYPDGSLGYFNNAFEELTGYTKQELKKSDWSLILTPPEFREMEQQKLEELQRTGQPVRYQKEYILKDGTRVPIELFVHLIRKDDGTPNYYYSFITDITERLQAEEKLKESEARFRSVFKNSLDVIYRFNLQTGRYDYMSPAIRALGFEPEELMAMSDDDVISRVHPDDRSYLLSVLSQINQNGKGVAEYRFLGNDDVYRWWSNQMVVIKDSEGNPLYRDGSVRDITKRKQIEDALLESEERLRLAQTRGNVGVWDWNTVTDELNFTPELERLYGLSPGTIITYQDWRQLTHPDDIKKIEAERDDKIAKHEPFDLEFRIFHKSGDIRWLSAKGGAIYNKEGDIVRVLGINMDITERKKTEDALRESEERFRDLADNIPNLAWMADANGWIFWYNKQWYEYTGTTLEEMRGWGWQKVHHPDYVQAVTKEWSTKIKEGKPYDNIFPLRSKDGNYRWFLTRITPIKDEQGKLLRWFGTNTDITERKQAEIELKDTLDNLEELVEERTKELLLANDYNRNLIETSLDPLVTIGPDGKITDVNRATEEVTGYSREELVGSDFADYFTNPGKAREGYQQVFEEGKVRDYPLKIKHKYGSITPVLYNASVYKDESGEVVGVFAAARDITERQKAEDAFRVYWESLEEQVKQRTEELAKSNADLKQFAYVASHDLREPLRMITSFLQLLERRYKDQLDEDANEFIGFAVDGAKRLDKMIMDLLEYSRVANKETQYTDVNLEEIIHQIISNIDVLIDENNAQITYDSLPTIKSDENLMVHLFQNLISNAIKYRSEETPQIHIFAEKEDDKYVFSVKDNGIGIEPQHLERIFTIFNRLHTHQEYEGSGIGLSIAQRIVHQHGGEIWAESQPGKGSTFYFTIPY